MNVIIDKLRKEQNLTDEQIEQLLSTDEYDRELFASALEIREKYYGRQVFIRGLIEISSFCRNDCYYCGIRRSNANASRYRLTAEQIMECCRNGYGLGFRTFVLQGGEDPWFNDERMCSIVKAIKDEYPDCAVTLSLGERTRESYERLFLAGADRYLLRHETADEEHYRRLHPEDMSFSSRQRCLRDLKEIGYATGSGFMVGSPGQNIETLVKDIRFLQELEPDMIGIGPYLRHKDTPFRDCANGSMEMTLRLIGLLRHLFPKALIPSTTALGTIHPQGREMGMLAGANVVMPNLSPLDVREKYELYDDKICTGDEAAECRKCLENRMAMTGFEIVVGRGDRA